MKDVMLDIETWGTRPGCAIRSIGAAFFDPYGGGESVSEGIGSMLYINVSDASCEKYGLTIDPGTVQWWGRQSKEAQDALLTDQADIDAACWQLATWWQRNGGVRIWSHGANFDQPILQACFEAVGMTAPWSFWDSRCTRTLYDLAGLDTREAKREGTHHNALDDCRFQVACAQAAYRRIKGESSLEDIRRVASAGAPLITVPQPTAGDVFA